jgi:hypothetical protein
MTVSFWVVQPVADAASAKSNRAVGAAAAVVVVEAAVVVVVANVATGSVTVLAVSLEDELDEPDEPAELHAPSSDIATTPITVLLPIWKF